MKIKITFIRHGESVYNLKNFCNSRPNNKVVITPLGKKQAAKAAKELSREPFQAIFISQLIRTRQTADIINRFHKLPLIEDKRLNDRATGFEGKHVNYFYQWRSLQKSPFKSVPPGGESYEQMKARLRLFLKDLRTSGLRNVLVVTHLPIIKAARGYFLELSNTAMDSWTEKQVPNCRIIQFKFPKRLNKK